jgi:plasmid maintenance system antidote protein VapI
MPTKRTASISDTLRDVILERGLSAGSIATEARVTPSSVSRFVARQRGLTTETFDAVAEALGLKLIEGRGGLGTAADTKRRRAKI